MKLTDKKLNENEIVKRADKINDLNLGGRLNFRIIVHLGEKRISGYSIYSDFRYSLKSEPLADHITKKEAHKFFDKIEKSIKKK